MVKDAVLAEASLPLSLVAAPEIRYFSLWQTPHLGGLPHPDGRVTSYARTYFNSELHRFKVDLKKQPTNERKNWSPLTAQGWNLIE